MIVGDDTRTRVRPGRSEPRHPHAATTLARPREDPAERTQNSATRREWSRGTPRHATTHRQRGQRFQRPNDALRASPRHDHPDAPARRRGHPWPPEHASAVPTNEESTTRPQERTRLPPAAPTAKNPCSGQNPGRESPTVIHGAPKAIVRTAAAARSRLGETERRRRALLGPAGGHRLRMWGPRGRGPTVRLVPGAGGVLTSRRAVGVHRSSRRHGGLRGSAAPRLIVVLTSPPAGCPFAYGRPRVTAVASLTPACERHVPGCPTGSPLSRANRRGRCCYVTRSSWEAAGRAVEQWRV